MTIRDISACSFKAYNDLFPDGAYLEKPYVFPNYILVS
jgi:hypothetical protein